MTDADYTNDLALLVNTHAQAESLLLSQMQASGDIGLYAQVFKEAISALSGGPLKSIYKFTYLDCNISSTESHVNVRLAQAWTAFDRLSIVRKYDLCDKIQQDFFQAVLV